MAGGGARFSRKGVPSRLVFPVGVDEAMAAAAWWNNAPTCPRPVGALLRCRRRVRELLYRSPGRVSCLLAIPLAFFFEGCRDGCWVCEWRPTRSSSTSPRRRRSSVVGSDPGVGGVGRYTIHHFSSFFTLGVTHCSFTHIYAKRSTKYSWVKSS